VPLDFPAQRRRDGRSIMLIRTWLGNSLAALVQGRSPAATAQTGFPTAHEAVFETRMSSDQEPLLDFSLVGQLLVAAVIFVLSALAVHFTHSANFISTFWLSNAITLVALLRHVRSLQNYGSTFLGAAGAIWLANFVNGSSPALSAIMTLANLVEIATALALLHIFRIGAANLTQLRNLLIFIVLACGIAPITSATIGGLANEFSRGIPWLAIWRNWYLSDALGMIIVVPFLVSITSSDWRAQHIKERQAEAAAVFALVVIVGICAAYFRSAISIIVPAILFATLRFGVIGATAANFVTAVIVSSFVVLGIGQPVLARPELSDRVLALQILMAFMSLWSLPIAVLLRERDHLLSNLARANSELKLESETKTHLVVGLRRHLLIAEEKERLRLSHELHDQAGQSLIAAILELNEIDSLTDGPARERLQNVRRKMETLGNTLHRIAWELRPPSIDELGMKKALASYIAEWGEQRGTEVDFHCDDANFDDVPSEIGTAIYRIVQEGLTNIVERARQPSNVSVVIRRVTTVLQVIIEDNGCGFDIGAATAKPRGRGRIAGQAGVAESAL
jgi:signal transduction histidine kinase